MTGVNLAPASRKYALLCQKRIRVWASGGVAYGVVLLVTYAVCFAHWNDADAQVDDQAAGVLRHINESNQALSELRVKLTTARVALRASSLLTENPDWSVVLRLLARNLGKELVLSRCQMQSSRERAPGDVDPVSAAVARPISQFIHLVGFARSQAAISAFALRLEQTGLFVEVNILETKREPFLSGEAFAFSLMCSIADSGSSP